MPNIAYNAIMMSKFVNIRQLALIAYIILLSSCASNGGKRVGVVDGNKLGGIVFVIEGGDDYPNLRRISDEDEEHPTDGQIFIKSIKDNYYKKEFGAQYWVPVKLNRGKKVDYASWAIAEMRLSERVAFIKQNLSENTMKSLDWPSLIKRRVHVNDSLGLISSNNLVVLMNGFDNKIFREYCMLKVEQLDRGITRKQNKELIYAIVSKNGGEGNYNRFYAPAAQDIYNKGVSATRDSDNSSVVAEYKLTQKCNATNEGKINHNGYSVVFSVGGTKTNIFGDSSSIGSSVLSVDIALKSLKLIKNN